MPFITYRTRTLAIPLFIIYKSDQTQTIRQSRLTGQVPSLEAMSLRYGNAWTQILSPREQASLFTHLWVFPGCICQEMEGVQCAFFGVSL